MSFRARPGANRGGRVFLHQHASVRQLV